MWYKKTRNTKIIKHWEQQTPSTQKFLTDSRAIYIGQHVTNTFLIALRAEKCVLLCHLDDMKWNTWMVLDVCKVCCVCGGMENVWCFVLLLRRTYVRSYYNHCTKIDTDTYATNTLTLTHNDSGWKDDVWKEIAQHNIKIHINKQTKPKQIQIHIENFAQLDIPMSEIRCGKCQYTHGHSVRVSLVCAMCAGMYWFEMRCYRIFQRRKKEFSHSISCAMGDTFVKFTIDVLHWKNQFIFQQQKQQSGKENEWNEMKWKKAHQQHQHQQIKQRTKTYFAAHTQSNWNWVDSFVVRLTYVYFLFDIQCDEVCDVLTGTVVISNRFRTAVSYYLAKVMFTLHPIAHTQIARWLLQILTVDFFGLFLKWSVFFSLELFQMKFRPFFSIYSAAYSQ